VTAPFAIRPEGAGDRAGIRAVHRAAFGGPAEAALVDALREAGDLALALVAVAANGPVGHAAFPRLAIEGGSVRAVALAPLAVLPEWHGRGVGTGLVEVALGRLRAAGEDLVLVRGHPAYYRRFGFSPEPTQTLRTPWDGPHMQALALTSRGREAAGPVAYPPAFAALL
jgi:putative acetyltransferase